MHDDGVRVSANDARDFVPTVTGMSHQPSAHARTPRVAQIISVLMSRSKVARGIAPRLCEIR